MHEPTAAQNRVIGQKRPAVGPYGDSGTEGQGFFFLVDGEIQPKTFRKKSGFIHAENYMKINYLNNKL